MEYARVWDALASCKGEADLKAARAEILHKLRDLIHGMNLGEAHQNLDADRDQINDIYYGKLSRFTLDDLVKIADNNGIVVNISVSFSEKGK